MEQNWEKNGFHFSFFDKNNSNFFSFLSSPIDLFFQPAICFANYPIRQYSKVEENFLLENLFLSHFLYIAHRKRKFCFLVHQIFNNIQSMGSRCVRVNVCQRKYISHYFDVILTVLVVEKILFNQKSSLKNEESIN